MKLLIIRHGDPDYSIDSLTETGWKEAELLSQRISKLDVKEFYVSPLGRAKDTASLTLKKMGRNAEECEWLREFTPTIDKPWQANSNCIWDWPPAEWTKEPKYFDRNAWMTTDIMVQGKVQEEAERVIGEFDDFLARHGYRREKDYYRVEKSNEDSLVFFCHFGLECLLLSHLLNISPMVLWHNFCAAPSSVTTVVTEERQKGIASFRMSAFGDISHLYAGGREPSFAARFCETYERNDQRHD